MALSRLFRRALAEGRAVINPIALVDKPTIQDHEAVWLTLEEGWRLLEAAKQYDAETGKGFLARGMLYPMIATFLLTGARRDECFALRRSDMDYEARVVHIRAYGDHRLKRGHARVVPLWPQLADILRDYLRSRPAHISNLLFPSPTPHVRYGVKSWRLEKIETALTWAEKAAKLDRHVTLHTCRHSYASNRLRTVEQGPDGQRIPVSLFRVSRELGHQSTRLLETTYGHIETDPAKMAMEVRYAAKQKSPHQASTGTAS